MLIRITDDAGRPVPGAVVGVASEVADLREIAYVTDDAGTFEAPIPASGAYVFAVSKLGERQRVRVHLEAGAPEATVAVAASSARYPGPTAPATPRAPTPTRGNGGEHESRPAERPSDATGSEGWEGQ